MSKPPDFTKSNLNFPVAVPGPAPSLVPPEVDSRVVIKATLALGRTQADMKPDDTDCLSVYFIS